MQESSSEEDIEEVNIFQKARQTRLKSNSRSPSHSPAKTPTNDPPKLPITSSPSKPWHSPTNGLKSPPRKTRKLNLEAGNLDIFDEPALLIPPPPNWAPVQPEEAPGREGDGIETDIDTSENEVGLPSSETIDPEVMNMLLAHRASSIAEVNNTTNILSQEITLKLSLQDFLEMRSAEFSTNLLAGIFSGDANPLDSLVEEVEVDGSDGSASRIEKTEINILKSMLHKLHSKMAQEKEALLALQEWRLDKKGCQNLIISFENIWKSSHKRAEISRLKLKLTLLRDTRMRLLQLFNDIKHEQSQFEATNRVYFQLSEQLQEAQQMVNHYQQSAKEAEKLEAEIANYNAEVANLRRELIDIEIIHEKHLQDIESAVLAKAQQIEKPPNTENSIREQQLAHLITNLKSSFGARVVREPENAEVTMPFLSISVNLSSATYDIHWSLPPVCNEILDHFKKLIESSRVSIKKSLAMWHRALAIHKVLIELLNYGFIRIKKADPEAHVLELLFTMPKANFTINVHGTAVFVDGLKTNLDTLPPQIEKLQALKETNSA